MKFSDVIVSLVFLSMFFCEFNYGYVSYKKLLEKKESIQSEVESCKFISESFRKTCEGNGFESLKEWQKVCKSLWKLDYIGFADADSFMIVENNSQKKLIYGRWIGPFGHGEVYCRVK